MAFNAKNLTYETKEPSFLKKLRGEYGGGDSMRHAHQQKRPKRLRDAADDDSDEPVYMREEDPHQSLSKAEYEALIKIPADQQRPGEQASLITEALGSKAAQSTPSVSSPAVAPQETSTKQERSTIGGASKKRAAKIVGEDASADEAQTSPQKSSTLKKPSHKKAKKLKLSFDDD
ncbi:MAG: hypothetical protein Q9183_001914 [Haloplaca sp. 2 TL-2023]